MTSYFDSSALIPIYVPEEFSPAARAAVRAAGQIPFLAFHQLEVRNAFEQLTGRRLITRDESRVLHAQLENDLEERRLLPVTIDLDQAFVKVGELSRLHTAKFLARSLDLLHVAAAHIIESRTFVSADDRQLAVAKASGLKVVDIKRRQRRRTLATDRGHPGS